jgi:hypothetical protein
MSRQLGAEISHAIIDVDSLWMIHPRPPREAFRELTRRNLATVWKSFAECGCKRLLLALVLDNPAPYLAILRAAIPDAQMTVVRLQASPETLRERLKQREIGSGLEESILAADEAAQRIDQLDDSFPRIATDGRTIVDVAREALQLIGWLPERRRDARPLL